MPNEPANSMFNIDLVHGFISSEKKSLKIYILMTVAIVLLGVIILMYGIYFEDDHGLLKIGAGFISTLSAIPFQKLIPKLSKIDTLNLIATKMNRGIDDQEKEKIEELLYKLIEGKLEIN